MPLPAAFQILTLAWLVLLGPACYFLLRSAHFSPGWSAIGALLVYSLYYLLIFNLAYPYMTDPPAFVMLAVSIGFAYRKHRAGFTLALVAGVLAKETAFLAVPVWLCLA